MKYIISTNGKEIKFNLSGTRKLNIHPHLAIEVSDQEFETLNKRLGSQIKDVPMN